MVPEIAIMIEGQMGLNWPRWKRMVRAVEDLGFAGLYRSDHFTNAQPPDDDSLELWVALTWLADHTEQIDFGPLVSPVSFRHPAMTARMAAAVQELSSGRLTLGVGAGWNEREHTNYSYDLLDTSSRFARFEEALEVLSGLLRGERVTYQGAHYDFHDAVVLPQPSTPVPLLIGGNGMNRTLTLVARYASEWNGVHLSPEAFAARVERLDDLLREHGRQPSDVKRSLMTGLFFGRDDTELNRVFAGEELTNAREDNAIVGTPGAVRDQLEALAEAGVQCVMLKWLQLDDLDRLEAFAAAVL